MPSKLENVKLAIQAIDCKLSKLNHRRNELEAMLTRMSRKPQSTTSAKRTPTVGEPQATPDRGATLTGVERVTTNVEPKVTVSAGGSGIDLCPEELAVVTYYRGRIKAGCTDYDSASEFMPSSYRSSLKAVGIDAFTLRKYWMIAVTTDE